MKFGLKNIALPLFLLIIGGLFTYYLNLQRTDVRYTLSENIPITISGSTSSESIQQLTVKNLGNVSAQKIITSIQKQVNSYEIIKNSQSDNIQQFPTSDSLEIVYPELPPQGSYKLILKTQGDGIKINDIIIKHNNGIARDALSSKSLASTFTIILTIILLVFYFLFIIHEVAISWLEHKAKFKSSADEILMRKTPFYIGDKKWDFLRKEAIENLLDEKYVSMYTIENEIIYKRINKEKPDYYTDGEWLYIIDKSSIIIINKLLSAISCCLNENIILEILRVQKPINLLDNKWIELIKNANQKYVAIRKTRILFDIDSIANELESNKPNEILIEYWKGYIEFRKNEYFMALNLQVYFSKNAVEFLGEQKLHFLIKKEIDSLSDYAYRLEFSRIPYFITYDDAVKTIDQKKADWIKETDYNKIMLFAKIIVDLEHRQRNYNVKLDMINSILISNTLPEEKPENLDVNDWKLLNNIKNRIV